METYNLCRVCAHVDNFEVCPQCGGYTELMTVEEIEAEFNALADIPNTGYDYSEPYFQ